MISYIVTFICIWWLILLMALPIAIESNGKEGIEGSPPKQTHLKIKIFITTILAIITTYFAAGYFNQFLLNLHN